MEIRKKYLIYTVHMTAKSHMTNQNQVFQTSVKESLKSPQTHFWPVLSYHQTWCWLFSFLQYVGDEDFGETIKSYSSVKKEQTMFTDTHLWSFHTPTHTHKCEEHPCFFSLSTFRSSVNIAFITIQKGTNLYKYT